MYRARAEIVSGTSVFASGKWLRCIGNKPVRVGELIWTDGRVVFGNYQESQQPTVILPNEPPIPILLNDRGYKGGQHYKTKEAKLSFCIFSKGKLKELDKSEDFFPNFNAFINDTKSNSFVLGDYLLETYNFVYQFNGISIKRNYICSLKGILATNIDKEGNLFDLFMDGFDVMVRKNGETLRRVNFKQDAINLHDNTPSPQPFWIPDELNIFTADVLVEIYSAFIENADKWFFGLQITCNKNVRLNADWQYLIIRWEDELHDRGGKPGNTNDTEIFYYTDKGKIRYNVMAPLPHLPLQDNYYYTEEFTLEGLNQDYDYDYITHTWVEKPGYVTVTGITRSFYSPKGKKIFSGLFPPESLMSFRKVKGGYLLGVASIGITRDPNPDEVATHSGLGDVALPVFRCGLFLLQNGKWRKLSIYPCLNQRLRPLKHFKNWHQRIKFLS